MYTNGLKDRFGSPLLSKKDADESYFDKESSEKLQSDFTSHVGDDTHLTEENRELLNNLANGYAYITESWQSGSNWYRKYSDGWIEQGGSFKGSGSTSQTISFNTAFTSIPLLFLRSSNVVNASSNNQNHWDGSFSTLTTSSATCFIDSAGSIQQLWYACGH